MGKVRKRYKPKAKFQSKWTVFVDGIFIGSVHAEFENPFAALAAARDAFPERVSNCSSKVYAAVVEYTHTGSWRFVTC
jgi:hypothetical protein